MNAHRTNEIVHKSQMSICIRDDNGTLYLNMIINPLGA